MNKKLLAGVLVIVIIVLLVAVYSFKDTLFTNKITITYADGCKETFIDAELVTPRCDNPFKYPIGSDDEG